MIGICKILFDVCFYYTLSGFYLYLISKDYPSFWGVPVLMLSAIAWMVISKRRPSSGKGIDPITIICCALPGLIFVFSPTIWQIIQYLPAWAFFGFTIWNGLVNTDRRMFENHFGFTGRLYFLLLFGITAIQTHRVGDAVIGIIPYLIIYLLTGVCLMRILREEGKLTRGRNVAVLLIMLLSSIVLAGLQAPQLIMNVTGFIYRNVISQIIMGAAIAFGAVVYFIYRIFARLFSFLNFGEHEVNLNLEGLAPEEAGEEAAYIADNIPAWLEIVAAVLLILIVALVIFLILRRLLGKKTEDENKEFYKEERENLRKRSRGLGIGLIRPKDPRLAIRWYYRKYLKEGASRRGSKPIPADTSMDILYKYSPFFPGDDSGELRSLYIAARYGLVSEIPKSAVDRASALWSSMK